MSGSPPVLSISLSDHSFSALASRFARMFTHSRPLWRFMFFSKRAFNALSCSSRCSGDKSFLLLSMFRAFVALIVVATRVSYLLLRCAPPHVVFGLSLRSYQFAVSTPFGVHPSVHRCSPLPGGYACVPFFPSRQESAGKSRAPPPQTLPGAAAEASDCRSPLLATRAKQISYLLHEKPGIPREGTLPRLPGSGQSCENLLRSCGDSHSSERVSYLTISGWHMSTARGRITGNLEGCFRIADYALRDSIPSRPSPLGTERCEHSQIRLRNYAASDCKLAVPA